MWATFSLRPISWERAALQAPFVELSSIDLTTIQIDIPLVLGPDNSEVQNDRLVPGSMRLELLVLKKVSACFEP